MVSIRAVTGIFENKSACLVVNPIRVGSFPEWNLSKRLIYR